jgi:hypothetical protein
MSIINFVSLSTCPTGIGQDAQDKPETDEDFHLDLATINGFIIINFLLKINKIIFALT